MKQYIYGIHAVEMLLSKQPAVILELITQKTRQDQRLTKLVTHAKKQGIAVNEVPRAQLDKLANARQHQGIVAHCRHAQTSMNGEQLSFEDLLDKIAQGTLASPPFLLILDGIQDPHNLGACLRSADAAGVHAVIAPKDNSVSLTPTVHKVACGAAETVPFIQVTNLARSMKQLQQQGVWIYGTADDASDALFDIDLSGAVAVVIGAEGKGLRRLTKETCDGLLRIPMHGEVSSLNASVATGVCLFEVVRQRSG